MTMIDAAADRPLSRTPTPIFRTAVVLWGLGMVGMVLVLPYVATLEAKALAATAAQKGIAVWILLALSLAQTAVLLIVAAFAGLWAARALGLGAPLLTSLLYGTPKPARMISSFLVSAVVGALGGGLLIALDRWVFAPFVTLPVNHVIPHPSALQGFLASFYGAFDEETLLRLGALSLIALLFRTVARLFGADRRVALSSGVFWAANLSAALLFAAGHLPAAAAIMPMTLVNIARIIVLNGTVGIVFGVLYRRYGIEWAMTGHFFADIALHVLAA